MMNTNQEFRLSPNAVISVAGNSGFPFSHGWPDGVSFDVLEGFVNDGEALGRPVGVAIARAKALLVADDVGNSVWRVAPSGPTMAESRNVGTDIR